MQNNELTARNKQLPNIGVLEAKLPYELFEGLSNEIERLTTEGGALKYNHNLVGHIEEEYSLNHVKDHLEEFLIAMASTWQEANPGLIDAYEEAVKLKDWSLYLDSMWYNKQKKYEFNPLHFHSGALSFVIWIKIPYELEDEINYFPPVCGVEDDVEGNTYQYDRSTNMVYGMDLGRKVQGLAFKNGQAKLIPYGSLEGRTSVMEDLTNPLKAIGTAIGNTYQRREEEAKRNGRHEETRV